MGVRDTNEDKRNNEKLAHFLKTEKFKFGENSNSQKSFPNFYSSVYNC